MFKKICKYIAAFFCGIASAIVGILLLRFRNRPSSDRVEEGIRDSKTTVGEMGETISEIERESESIRDTVEQLKRSNSELGTTEDEFRKSTDRFGQILSEIETKRHNDKS